MTEFSKIDEAQILEFIKDEPLLEDCTDAQQAKFVSLVVELHAGQQVMNLTSIKDPRAMVRYHIADSVALNRAVRKFGAATPSSAADIGTGGGFPLLPMAILWPETDWVGIESIGKKAAFVERTSKDLGLSRVSVLAKRAEDLGHHSQREAFGLVTSRAVGPISSLLEVGMPLLETGGRLYLFKTDRALPEWRECTGFLTRLGGNVVGEYQYELEGDEHQRLILVAEKIGTTPSEYPRAAGLPFKKPLVKPCEVSGGPR